MPNAEKLPVLGLVGASLHDVFGNLGGLVRIAFAYYALAAVFAVLGMVLVDGTWLTDTVAALVGGGTAQLILSLAVLACIVLWQRHVLVAAPLRGTAPLNGRVMRYAWWSLMLSVICGLPVVAAAAGGFAGGLIWFNTDGTAPFGIGTGGIALLSASLILALVLFVRLGLVLPAISADDRTMGLRQSWAATRGHGMRLVGLFLLLLGGLGILGALAGLAQALIDAIAAAGTDPTLEAAGMTSTAGVVAGSLLNSLLDLITAMIGASVTARVYRHLAAMPGEAAAG